MEPRIVTKEAFAVVGIPFSGRISHDPYEDGENNNEIGKVWDELNSRAAEFKHWSGPGIGLCFGSPDSDEPWYLAGGEVSAVEDVPTGMIVQHVAAQKYAVFECTLPTIGQTYGYIMEQWQPASGYERAEAPDFELYDEKWDNKDPLGSPMHIYWPIK
jgi:AraC family transcriptional regulator